jgi:hypothetical protein
LQKFHAHVTIWGDNNNNNNNNNNKTFESKVFARLACLVFLIVGKKTSKDFKRAIETWDRLRRPWAWAKDQDVSKFYIWEFGQT